MEESLVKKGQKQYAELIKALKKIEKEEQKRRENFFKLRDILYRNEDGNLEVHKKILNCIASFGSNEQELEPLVGIAKTLKKERGGRAGQKYVDKDIEYVIEQYLTLYYNKYFRVISGNPVKTSTMLYDYTNSNTYEEKLRRSADNSLPLILMPSGECYFSTSCHKDLCGWLTAQNIDLSGASRIFISHKNHMFTMTSLWNYGYTENSTMDKSPILTKEQAEAINLMYKELKSRWHTINSMNEVVKHSNFFSEVVDKEQAEKNLKTLDKAFDSDDFSIGSYNEYLFNLRHGRVGEYSF